MTEKPPLWADLLLTAWVAVVAVIFFGPIIVPILGLWAAPASVAFVVMVMAAVVTLALRVVHRRDAPKPPPADVRRSRPRTKR